MNASETLKGVIKEEWCDRCISDIMQASPAIINGMDDAIVEFLDKNLGIKTIRDMSHSKYFMIARMLEIMSLAEGDLRHEEISNGLTFASDTPLIAVA